jgi:hypothetical protein
MWKLFKEYVWDKGWGKVFTIVASLELGYSLYVLVAPERVAHTFTQIDDRVWYGIAYLFLISICLLVLRGASKYRKMQENNDSIRIVYNENKYAACREISEDIETIRVGLRVVGKQTVENPVVLPTQLFKEDSDTKSTRIPIVSTPFSAMVSSDKVHSGFSPEYWINLLMHKLNSNEIQLCYDNYPSKPISLSVGRYRLELIARGTPSRTAVGTLYITVSDEYKLNFDFEGLDQWSTI